MQDNDDLKFRPAGYAPRAPRRRTATLALLVALLVAGAALLWFLYSSRGEPTAAPQAQAPVAAPQAPARSANAIEHPVAELQPPADFASALRGLAGRAGMALLQESDFIPRFVATVDNLGREHAPSAVWPVLPTPGRFATRPEGDRTVIAEANAKRYAAFVNWVDSVDTAAAVELYRGAYPDFQQAYRDLGYGERYFNDRLVAVIDLLLRTPEPSGPLAVQLLEVKGPHQSQRPWVRYELADERLQGLASGQKILLRMGPEHRQRLKAKLAEIRRLLAARDKP